MPPQYNIYIKIKNFLLLFLILVVATCNSNAQSKVENNDSVNDTIIKQSNQKIKKEKKKDPTQFTSVSTLDTTLHIIVRNIDISRYPKISVVFDVLDMRNNFVSNVTINDVKVNENGNPQIPIEFSLLTNSNRVPVDFIFAIDRTGSMGDKIKAVKVNIDRFVRELRLKGIDYRLGLVIFDDNVTGVREFTDNTELFKSWVDSIEASGGGDEEENALEALRTTTKMNTRQSANKCAVLITDAPYHSYETEKGAFRTQYTANSIASLLDKNDIRVFAIVSPFVYGYTTIAEMTGGKTYDINRPFADILEQFANTLTSLYTITYKTNSEIIPDSMQVQIKVGKRGKPVIKKFALLEVGRKLVIDIHFPSGANKIQQSSNNDIENLAKMLKLKPTIKLKIEGHTDNTGDPGSNILLSIARAESVRSSLIKKGIEADRLTTIGYGLNRPTATNDTEDGKQLNRRTEFVIMQK